MMSTSYVTIHFKYITIPNYELYNFTFELYNYITFEIKVFELYNYIILNRKEAATSDTFYIPIHVLHEVLTLHV